MSISYKKANIVSYFPASLIDDILTFALEAEAGGFRASG
jgi:hypothetical protein